MSLIVKLICYYKRSGVVVFNFRNGEVYEIFMVRKCNLGILYRIIVLFKYKLIFNV